MEPGKPEVEAALGDNPQSIYALGKQFQVVGRSKLGIKNPDQQQYSGVLKLLSSNAQQLDLIERTLSLLVAKTKGGGK